MKFVAGLTCHLCGKTYRPEALWVCSDCLGPLEVSYEYGAIRWVMTRALIESLPRSVLRASELLIVYEMMMGLHSTITTPVRAKPHARELGLDEHYMKEDSVNQPTFSYTNRVV